MQIPTIPLDIVALVTAFGALFATVWDRIIKWRKEQADLSIEQAHLDVVRIYEILQECGSDLNAGRVLLLYTSNGGGKPSPGVRLFTSILYEVVKNNKLELIRENYQNVPLDEAYAKVLSKIISEGFISIKPADLDDGLLKDMYISEGVMSSVVVPVVSTKEKFYYLSIRWYDEKSIPSGPLKKMVIENAARKIADVIKNHAR